MKQRFGAAWVARALLLLLLIVVFVAAIFIAGASLHDPDTCWLLMLGKRIVESGALPTSDPYSYTMALFPEKRFVLYQWLTEVLFFLSYKVLDLMGLLLLAAIVLTAAFVSIPLAFARKIGMPGAFAVIGTILTLIAAFFHFLCRPEIFSYLFLGIYFALTHFFLRNRNIEKTEKIDWKAVTIFGAVMMLWCNLHSAFVLGLGYLCIFAVVTTVSDFIAEKRLSAINQTILLCFAAAFVATFINPYGAGLWQYLPTLFFTPINKHIVELRPLSGKDFLEWTYYPFFILLISSVVITARALIKKIDEATVNSPRGQIVFAAVAILSWTVAGICCRRLIPFAALHMFAEGGYMLALLRAQRAATQSSTTEADPPFWEMADNKIDSLYQPRGFMWFTTIAVFAAAGVFFVATRIPGAVVLPQSGSAMQAPFDAIKFIAEKTPAGRVFNDPQFGDIMISKMPEPPKLFIDTRFDMYGKEIVDDYVTMYAAKPGWEDLMKRYKISWIFVRPDAEVSKRLLADKAWKVLYQDKASIVMQSPTP
ncbi:MAG: hypothetical protein IT342_17715 [Candidatus Melainabacteria bacterium]|nr:hypothetical protein [Candidatus Melainabacteria bacterium]